MAIGVSAAGSRNPASDQRPAALVAGAGISGMTAALDLAKQGLHVYLLEEGDIIGGLMSRISRTFPTGDCPT